MADERSASGSVVDSVISFVTDHGKPINDKGLVEQLKLSLARDAAEKTVLNGGYHGEPVVKSPLIQRMLAAYGVASTGRVIVVCSPADNGKSVASEFFVHGAHPFRPQRSLMLSAAGMTNFPKEYAAMLGVKSVESQLGAYLCNALAGKASAAGDVAGEVIGKAGDFVGSSLCLMPEKRRFKQDIELLGGQIAQLPVDIIKKMPVLIIDNFNAATEENKKFATQLFNSASASRVFVFVMTTNKAWATTLVRFNGGRKIKPLHGNVNNPNYTLDGTFSGDPDWNDLQWPVATLRELIQPMCQQHGINTADVVPDNANMTPVEAKDRVNARVMNLVNI